MISVIIPTLNEKKNIIILSKKLIKIKIIGEIIFVDDNSEDGTFNTIKELKYKKIKAYKRLSNRDLCKSVIFGIKRSKFKNILVMDCDLQHDTKYIPMLWKKFKSNNLDIVIASRFQNNRIYGNLGIIRSSISKLAIGFINIILGKKTSDPLSGFFLCKKHIVTKHFKNFFCRGYKILFDIIYNGQRNLRISDVGIHFKKRRHEISKFNLRIIRIFLVQIIYTIFLVK